ncbi:MAG: hypothetical protein SO135_02950 [Sphaerochaetaceae bacterium]|jgi:hypothetical protein|nr:hypothetical protein [Sphaerochaetaceae bacterium]NLY07859.1 hypothetical protein [Spirochaetales bacterium]
MEKILFVRISYLQQETHSEKQIKPKGNYKCPSFSGKKDITAMLEDFRFNCKRISASENSAVDESWNTKSKAIGHK